MAIRYDKLWLVMKEKGVSQYDLITKYGFSRGQIDRLKKNEVVKTKQLDLLCQILDCKLEDIAEYVKD